MISTQHSFFSPPLLQAWGQFVSELKDFQQPERRREAVQCLNLLITNALGQLPDVLQYMSRIHNQSIFNFCAIPQVNDSPVIPEYVLVSINNNWRNSHPTCFLVDWPAWANWPSTRLHVFPVGGARLIASSLRPSAFVALVTPLITGSLYKYTTYIYILISLPLLSIPFTSLPYPPSLTPPPHPTLLLLFPH